MNQTLFDQLMAKFRSITTWTVLNAESNTQILDADIGGRKVKLYRGDVFAIDGERPQLTGEQVESANIVIQEILDNFLVEINTAKIQRKQDLDQSIQDVLNT